MKGIADQRVFDLLEKESMTSDLSLWSDRTTGLESHDKCAIIFTTNTAPIMGRQIIVKELCPLLECPG